MTRMTPHILVATTIALTGTAAGHDGDIGLRIVNNRIFTSAVIDTPQGSIVQGVRRVFGAEFIDFGGAPYADDPGLFAEPGTFPTSQLGFDILGPVLKWDGASFPAAPIPAETITIEFGPLSRTTPLANIVVPGFGINVGPAGFDEHYDFTLNAPASDGIYALSLRLWSDAPGIRESRPFYIIFNWNESEPTHDLAIDWARANLVPAPIGVAPMLAAAAFAMGRRRQR